MHVSCFVCTKNMCKSHSIQKYITKYHHISHGPCPLWGCAQAVSEVKISPELKIMFISSHVKQTNKQQNPNFCTELILAKDLKSWQVYLFQE